MSVQVLVAAVNKVEEELVEALNLQTDAIIANQSKENVIRTFERNGCHYLCLKFAERGVGLNRNNALMRASAEYCLFADDDMVYAPGYGKIVEEAFARIPDADVIVFNIVSQEPSPHKKITRQHRVRWYNFLRYATQRIAIRLPKIRENGILFNVMYGGGTPHCHGEDSIFLADCLKKGLHIWAVPLSIATLSDDRESSWFRGYDEKYVRDQGDLYRQISRRFWVLLCLQDALRRHRIYKLSVAKAFGLMVKGHQRQS